MIGPLANVVGCKKTALFDLTEKDAEVLGGLSPFSYSVHYYLTEQNAREGNNAIVMPYTPIASNQTIYVAVRDVGNTACTAIGTFNLIVLPALPEVFPVAINVCDDSSNDGIAVFDFEEQTALLLNNQPLGAFEITYHTSEADAVLGNNAVGNYSNTSNPQNIYARVASGIDASCFEVRRFVIAVHRQPTIVAPEDLYLCGGDGGFATVELLSFNEAILDGQSETDFRVTYHDLPTDAQQGINVLRNDHEVPVGSKTIYARVENINNPSCYAVVEFQVMVYPQPVIEMKTEYALCENGIIELSAPAGFDDYNWSTGETTSFISVTSPGIITLTVTNSHGMVTCSDTVTINIVNSSEAVIKEIIVSDWTENQNSIKISAGGTGNYEYSIDGETYQSSPEFHGLEIGEYTVYVRDINGCGIVEKAIYFLVYPKFFTPNGDGYNEKWHIKPSALEPELKVYIFDSTGRLLTLLDGRSEGWDGTFNNYRLPSADYWFVVERKSGKTFKGHFSLIR